MDKSQQGVSQKRQKILIVDDEPAIRMTVEEMLKPLGCKIIHAGNGDEAIEIVNRNDVDLVILDIPLPGRHGFQVCSAIRKAEQERHIPILMITAVYTQMKFYYQAKDSGADAYMIKPFRMDNLISKVSNFPGR